MKIILLSVIASFYLMSCSSETQEPLARIDIEGGAEVQARVINAVKRFGEQHGFTVYQSNDMPKGGRLVSQIDLQRGDGVVVTIDNFLNADVLTIGFYSKNADANWQEVKDSLREALVQVLNGQGKLEEL